MKYFIRLLLALSILSGSAYAYQPKIEVFEQFDNLKMVAFINVEEIDAIPDWDPETSAPPLTVGDAIRAVKEFVGSSDATGKVKEIEIRTVPKYDGKWHYLVKLADDSRETKYDIYVVLMSGKVIPGIIEPQAYK